MSREQANYLLGRLGAQHGIAEVGLDEGDFCCLALDDGIVLNLEYFASDDVLVVSSLLGELAHKPREQLFATLLKANFFWRETGGGTLALDDEVDAPFLQFQLPLQDLEVAGLEAALGRMLEDDHGRRGPDRELRARGADRARRGGADAGSGAAA